MQLGLLPLVYCLNNGVSFLAEAFCCLLSLTQLKRARSNQEEQNTQKKFFSILG